MSNPRERPPQYDRSPFKEVDFSHTNLLLSDWDGTLVDSMGAYAEVFARILSERFNIEPAAAIASFHHNAGVSWDKQIQIAVENLAGREVENVIPIKQSINEQLADITPTQLPGAEDFLRALNNRGIAVVVWSSSDADHIGPFTERSGLAPFIQFAIGTPLHAEGKTKGPGLFADVSERLQTTPSQLARTTLAIGDGVADIAAGRAIQAKTAGIYREQSNKQALLNAGADFVFNDYTQLLDKLKS